MFSTTGFSGAAGTASAAPATGEPEPGESGDPHAETAAPIAAVAVTARIWRRLMLMRLFPFVSAEKGDHVRFAGSARAACNRLQRPVNEVRASKTFRKRRLQRPDRDRLAGLPGTAVHPGDRALRDVGRPGATILQAHDRTGRLGTEQTGTQYERENRDDVR
ncbi:hypothetical protein GCM10022223_61000 [Kineosporia mesophila]|uniref:Uncharacterized protein n=1 Tax=Kineosporia mesophila TaxID=566012 RepID=A0ABP7AJX7_9ACTN